MDKSITIIGSSVIDVLASNVSKNVFDIGSIPVSNTCLSFGGNGLNEAVGIAKLGKDVNFVSLVGKDEAGDRILEHLSKNKVDTNLVVRKDITTSINIVLVDEAGERFFLTNPNSTLRKQSLEDIIPYIESFNDIVCFASLFVSPMLSVGDYEVLFKEIKESGRTLCVDMTKRKNGETIDDLKPILKYVDYIFPNNDEISLITGFNDIKLNAKVLIDANVGCSVIKQGKDGVFVKTKNYEALIPAVKVSKVIDTTGAGDSFAAGFIYGLSKGYDDIQCAKLGCAVASCSIEELGATNGIKGIDEVLKRLDASFNN